MTSSSVLSELTITRLLSSAALASALWLISRAIYNIYFHPLAKYPGPPLQAAFHFPYFWTIFKGSAHEDLRQLHEKYGEVVRFRPNALSFNTGGAWKDIHNSRPGKGQVAKDMVFYMADPKQVPSIITCFNDADHTRMRRLLAHAFSDAALREQESIITQYFELMVDGLSNACRAGQPVDMTRWYNCLAFDIIGELCFGEPFHALEKGQFHPWMDIIFDSLKFVRVIYPAKVYKPTLKILMGLLKFFPAVLKARKDHEEFAVRSVEKRLEMETERKDFVTYIQRHNDERGLSHPEILENLKLLILAGSETTATLLSGATHLLLTTPETYERAKAEVRSAFTEPGEMTFASTSKLPYLQALLEEALRMYPPVPGVMPRMTGPKGDWIDGHYLPGNTIVATPQWVCNRCTSRWESPETYAPERWLEGASLKYSKDDPSVMNPFSMGPRNCIGKNLAYNEMRSAMARVLWHFDMELCEDSRNWMDQKMFILWEKPALNVRLSFAKR